MSSLPLALLVQLPIPPPGPMAVEGNVPLAAAYLKLFAQRQGLGQFCNIELLPTSLSNTLGDQALVDAILARQPWLVGFSCYMWNVERSLWIAEQLKRQRPDLIVTVGGPEVTADNAWVLHSPAVDYAVLGEGEMAFAELLATCRERRPTPTTGPTIVTPRGSLSHLDAVSSPYIEGILDVADDRRLLLETVRGCRFHCKYCYYPKNFESARFLSDEQIVANLRHAVDRGATEVVLLDPTLNQRRDFPGFLRMLADNNPQRQLAFSGELRAEGINRETARLLRQANFHEVEIGLQSTDPQTLAWMGRPTNLAAFERGVKAMMDEGIEVCVDLILGLPGDSPDSFRRSVDFLRREGMCSRAQVFNLSILPGTAFRREAASLEIAYQPRPPYFVVKTPAFDVERMFELMAEAQDAFDAEFDLPPTPRFDDGDAFRIDLDACSSTDDAVARIPAHPTQCFTLWLRSADFQIKRRDAVAIVERILNENPYTTLQIILEPLGDPHRLTAETLESLLAACYRNATYLDRYYSLHPGALLGAKRLFVLPPSGYDESADDGWLDRIADCAAILE